MTRIDFNPFSWCALNSQDLLLSLKMVDGRLHYKGVDLAIQHLWFVTVDIHLCIKCLQRVIELLVSLL